jgi:hypothetical protein
MEDKQKTEKDTSTPSIKPLTLSDNSKGKQTHLVLLILNIIFFEIDFSFNILLG